jgi:uncharacterized repeat protein (TIGR03803 family)
MSATALIFTTFMAACVSAHGAGHVNPLEFALEENPMSTESAAKPRRSHAAGLFARCALRAVVTSTLKRIMLGVFAGTMFGIAIQSAPAQTETVLYTFSAATGSYPVGGLVRDKNGNLYGTTYQGANTGCGNVGCGAVYQLTPSGTLNVLHTFTGSPDGGNPEGTLVFDKGGNLYGTTTVGGAFGNGTVYRVTPGGQYRVLYSFSGLDGAGPVAGLVRDGAGNLYGITQYGGTSGRGTVFVLTPTGAEKVLHSFTGGADGGHPIGGLILWKGSLYGTTGDGGDYGPGTVFRVTKKGVQKVLYSFSGGIDGASPFRKLVVDKEGNFYGTTVGGGAYSSGTVFKVTSMETETVLYHFTGGVDGGTPVGGLVRDANGNLFGTTQMGGTNANGTVFKLSPSGTETVLHSFTRGASDGAMPMASLLRVGRVLYGTTFYGGPTDRGTVFKVVP